MNTFPLQTAELFDAPRLRLLSRKIDDMPASSVRARQQSGERLALRLVHEPAPELQPVLVAGADSDGRAAVLRDLSQTMPPNTIFSEADAFWEVLVRAPSSSMVILSGELDDVPAESLMQMLAHRHPGLPVVSLDP